MMPDVFSRVPRTEHAGIRLFAEKDFYWGNVPRDEMNAFLSVAESDGYAAACTHKPLDAKAFAYMNDYARADQIFFVPASRDAVVLDLGSGYGNLTLPLARRVRHVVAADGTQELLRYSRVRAQEEGIENVTYVHIDPIEVSPLPFKEKSFDVIVMSGVLEWIGAGDTKVAPRDAQINALRQFSRLLKDGGVLYVAIENRWFIGWARRDPHSKLPWTAILPRGAADWYARRHGFKEGYRTYIYSLFGYRRLFKAGGFAISRTYLPQPGYRNPAFVYGTDRQSRTYMFRTLAKKMYTWKWRFALRLLSIFRIDHLFLSSFMFVATKIGAQVDTAPLAVREALGAQVPNMDIADALIKTGTGINEARFTALGSNNVRNMFSLKRLPRDPKEVRPTTITH